MDIEQLKIIIEALSQMGQAGVGAFIWYMVIVYGTSLLKASMGWAVAAFTVTCLYKAVNRGISKAK